MPGYTRLYIRQVVAGELGDLMVAKATAPGTVASIIDTINFAKEHDHFRGAEILFTSGANQGSLVVASSNRFDDRSITFAPALPTPTLPGDEVNIHNFHHRGWGVSALNRAINSAIAVAGEQHGSIPIAYDVLDVYSYKQGPIPIPDSFTEFHGIRYSTRYGDSKMLPPRYWDVNRYTMTVDIKTVGMTMMQGKNLTLLGMTEQPPLNMDTDTSDLPLEWLKTEIKAQLLESDTARGSINQRDRLYNVERTGADGRRPIIVARRPPNTVRLR